MAKKNTKIISPDFTEKNNTSSPDNTRELQEILSMTSSVRKRLEKLILQYEEADLDVSDLDEAVDALSDAAEIMEDVLGEIEDGE